jgi:hypothetical protein
VNRYEAPKQDIPVSVAVVMLVALAGAWGYFQAPALLSGYASRFDSYGEAHLPLLAALLFATSVNGIWTASVLSRTFGLNRQGQRLEILTSGRKASAKAGNSFNAVKFAFFLILSPLVYFAGWHWKTELLPDFLPPIFLKPLWAASSLNLGFAAFVVSSVVKPAAFFRQMLGQRRSHLPEMPKVSNALVLGALEEVSYE